MTENHEISKAAQDVSDAEQLLKFVKLDDVDKKPEEEEIIKLSSDKEDSTVPLV